MTPTLADELNDRALDADSVHHALRYYLSERLDDLPPEDMLEQLYRAAPHRPRVDEALARFSSDTHLLESGALAVLSAAWSETEEQDRLSAVLADTKGKLPVVEVTVIAIAVMYGLYLLATGGLRKTTTTVVRRPDGSFEIEETREYSDPAAPLTAIANIIRPGTHQATPPADHHLPAGPHDPNATEPEPS